jgi:hypothetical protein
MVECDLNLMLNSPCSDSGLTPFKRETLNAHVIELASIVVFWENLLALRYKNTLPRGFCGEWALKFE